MTLEEFRTLSWASAILFGFASFIPLGMVQYARGKFRAMLKEPLNDEVEHLTHLWERRIGFWTFIGLSMSGFSILCFVLWLASGIT